jgi:hypothetical protein
MEKKQNQTPKKSKLTLDDFKVKSDLTGSKAALEAISGGILGACHDSTPPGCLSNYAGAGY